MKLKIVNDISTVNIEEWKNFVINHPKGNVFQTPEMYEILKNSNKTEPFIFLGYNDNSLVGVLLISLQKENKSLIKHLTTRSIIIGGPLVLSDRVCILEEFIRNYNEEIKNKVIYTQFRNIFPLYDQEYRIMKENNFEYVDHLDIHIDLRVKFEDLVYKFNKSRKRNYKRAINKGVFVKELDQISDIKIFYKLIEKTYSRVKLPYPDRKHFIELFKNLHNKKMCLFMGAFIENKMIASRVVLLFNGMMYDYYAGHDEEYNNKYPNDYLIIKILEWGIKNDFNYFDFGGAGKPHKEYGVRDYKMKFGGNLVNFGRFEKIHKPILHFVIKRSFKIWRKWAKKQ